MSPAGNADNVANKVKRARLARGLTQQELGAAVGLTRQSIIAIEKGRFTPSIHSALVIARELGAPVGNLFWLADDGESGGLS